MREQTIGRLANGDEMLNERIAVGEMVGSFGIAKTTSHRWKNTDGAMKASLVKRPRGLGAENCRL